MATRNQIKRRWFLKGAAGALFLGTGVSCAIESGFLKNDGVVWYVWVASGTASLGLIVAGTVYLVQAGFLKQQLDKMKNGNE